MTNFNTDHSLLNWAHLWQTSQKRFSVGVPYEGRSCHRWPPFISPFPKFNMGHSFLNWAHLRQTSQKTFSIGMSSEGRSFRIAQIFFSINPSQTNLKYFSQEVHPLRDVAALLADTISSNDPIGEKLQHGLFLQINPLVTNFNLDNLFLNWSHLRKTLQKKHQQGFPPREVADSLAYNISYNELICDQLQCGPKCWEQCI